MTLLSMRSVSRLHNNLNLIRRFSNEKLFQEVSIPLPWGEIRGKWWGPTDIRPILTLHGWQDNCGSFDRLIPLLNKNIAFLAIDSPGHGYSSRIPLEWPRVTLMGHSLGGITSYTYSMLYPQNVDFLICIDGAKPMDIKNRIGTMSASLDKFMRKNMFAADTKEPPSYSIEEIKQKIHAPNKGSIDLECAKYIMERNIQCSKVYPGKYYFIRDPRLTAGELLSFAQNELVEQAQKITCPVFIAKCKLGSYYEAKENFYEVLDVLKRCSTDCDFHYVEGKHHAHLNHPEEIAMLVNKFIQKHNIEDRSIGGIKPEMIVTEEQDSRIIRKDI